jgi:hypothetical protein
MQKFILNIFKTSMTKLAIIFAIYIFSELSTKMVAFIYLNAYLSSKIKRRTPVQKIIYIILEFLS